MIYTLYGALRFMGGTIYDCSKTFTDLLIDSETAIVYCAALRAIDAGLFIARKCENHRCVCRLMTLPD